MNIIKNILLIILLLFYIVGAFFISLEGYDAMERLINIGVFTLVVLVISRFIVALLSKPDSTVLGVGDMYYALEQKLDEILDKLDEIN